MRYAVDPGAAVPVRRTFSESPCCHPPDAISKRYRAFITASNNAAGSLAARPNGARTIKTIGILGGMSAASTQIYYRELCTLTRDRLGGLHSPQLLIRSLDFAEIEALQVQGDWETAGKILNREALTLEQGGAELLLLATNTMHKLAERMMQQVSIPMIHIADATAEAILTAGLNAPALMATAFTMEQSFYTDRLLAAGLTPIVPDETDRRETHRIIYEELCKDIITPASRAAYVRIAERLIDSGADCLILGCTEIGMLLNQHNVAVPVFDTTLLHCSAALDMALTPP